MKIGLTPSFVIHDSLDVPRRLTASLAEHLLDQPYDATPAATLARLQRHEAAA